MTSSAPRLVVYWPTRRLHVALSSAGDEGSSIELYALGFCENDAVIVVDFGYGKHGNSQTYSSHSFGAVGLVEPRGEGLKTKKSRQDLLVFEYDPTLRCRPEPMDQSIRIASSSNPATTYHVILFDPRWCSSQPAASMSWQNTPLLQPLQQLQQRRQASRQQADANPHSSSLWKGVASVGYYAIYLPCSIAARAWNVMDAALSAPWLKWIPLGSGESLTDYSSTLNLLSMQTSMVLALPRQVRTRYHTRERESSGQGRVATYTQIMDLVLYLLLDYVCSFALHRFITAAVLPSIKHHSILPSSFLDSLRGSVMWLMGAPAGFKLNVRLASILGNGVLLWLDLWQFLFNTIVPSHHSAISSALASFWHHCGLSLQLCILADTLWLVTWNSTWVFMYFAKLNKMQFGILASLWKLFLGKKNNVLRKRVDTCEYDVNQLLLGTLLFTVLVFLVATNTVFLIFFGLVRLAVWGMWIALWTPIVILTGVPVASIAHRLVRPQAFTSSIDIEAVSSEDPVESLSIDDISAGSRRERDTQDMIKLREFMERVLVADHKGSRPLYFRAMPRPSSFGSLFIRLQSYVQEVSRIYGGRSTIKTSLSGGEVPTVDPCILFGHTKRCADCARSSRKEKTE